VYFVNLHIFTTTNYILFPTFPTISTFPVTFLPYIRYTIVVFYIRCSTNIGWYDADPVTHTLISVCVLTFVRYHSIPTCCWLFIPFPCLHSRWVTTSVVCLPHCLFGVPVPTVVTFLPFDTVYHLVLFILRWVFLLPFCSVLRLLFIRWYSIDILLMPLYSFGDAYRWYSIYIFDPDTDDLLTDNHFVTMPFGGYDTFDVVDVTGRIYIPDWPVHRLIFTFCLLFPYILITTPHFWFYGDTIHWYRYGGDHHVYRCAMRWAHVPVTLPDDLCSDRLLLIIRYDLRFVCSIHSRYRYRYIYHYVTVTIPHYRWKFPRWYNLLFTLRVVLHSGEYGSLHIHFYTILDLLSVVTFCWFTDAITILFTCDLPFRYDSCVVYTTFVTLPLHTVTFVTDSFYHLMIPRWFWPDDWYIWYVVHYIRSTCCIRWPFDLRYILLTVIPFILLFPFVCFDTYGIDIPFRVYSMIPRWWPTIHISYIDTVFTFDPTFPVTYDSTTDSIHLFPYLSTTIDVDIHSMIDDLLFCSICCWFHNSLMHSFPWALHYICSILFWWFDDPTFPILLLFLHLILHLLMLISFPYIHWYIHPLFILFPLLLLFTFHSFLLFVMIYSFCYRSYHHRSRSYTCSTFVTTDHLPFCSVLIHIPGYCSTLPVRCFHSFLFDAIYDCYITILQPPFPVVDTFLFSFCCPGHSYIDFLDTISDHFIRCYSPLPVMFCYHLNLFSPLLFICTSLHRLRSSILPFLHSLIDVHWPVVHCWYSHTFCSRPIRWAITDGVHSRFIVLLIHSIAYTIHDPLHFVRCCCSVRYIDDDDAVVLLPICYYRLFILPIFITGDIPTDTDWPTFWFELFLFDTTIDHSFPDDDTLLMLLLFIHHFPTPHSLNFPTCHSDSFVTFVTITILFTFVLLFLPFPILRCIDTICCCSFLIPYHVVRVILIYRCCCCPLFTSTFCSMLFPFWYSLIRCSFHDTILFLFSPDRYSGVDDLPCCYSRYSTFWYSFGDTIPYGVVVVVVHCSSDVIISDSVVLLFYGAWYLLVIHYRFVVPVAGSALPPRTLAPRTYHDLFERHCALSLYARCGLTPSPHLAVSLPLPTRYRRTAIWRNDERGV